MKDKITNDQDKMIYPFRFHQNVIFGMIMLCFTACAQHSKNNAAPQATLLSDSIRQAFEAKRIATIKEMADAQITYFVIHVPDNKFGYTIFVDGQLYIEQKNIPAIDGNAGFATKESAEKIAQLVISKMRNGEIPPTITIADLRANDIIE